MDHHHHNNEKSPSENQTSTENTSNNSVQQQSQLLPPSQTLIQPTQTTHTTSSSSSNTNQYTQQQQQPPPPLKTPSQSHQPLLNNVDVRMKRHPELQPYIPCDRFVPINKSSNPPIRRVDTPSGACSSLAPTSYWNPGASLDNSKPKKYVSMTRLNQLAQPKKTHQPQTQTQTQPNGQPQSLTQAQSQTQAKQQASTTKRASQQSKPTVTNNKRPPQARSSTASLNSTRGSKSTPTTVTTTTAAASSTSGPSNKAPSSAKAANTTTTTTNTRPNSVRRISRQSLKESTPLRHDLTFDTSEKEHQTKVVPIRNISPIRTSKSSLKEVNTKLEPVDHNTSTSGTSLEPRASSSVTSQSQDEQSITSSQRILSDNESLKQEHSIQEQRQQQYQSRDRLDSNRSSISNCLYDDSSNFASIRQTADDASTSLAEQMSEVSMNDRHFQSAASELLMPENLQLSTTTTSETNMKQENQSVKENSGIKVSEHNSQSSTMNNGTVNLSDRNPDSLLRELKEDLLSKGLALNDDFGLDFSPRVSTTTAVDNSEYNNKNTLSDELFSLECQHQSTATTWSPKVSTGALVSHQQSGDLGNISKSPVIKPNGLSDSKLEESIRRQREEEEEDRRLKIEQQIREQARCEEEEREQRGKLVESILSRFSQGSP